MWLLKHDVRVKCVKVTPYKHGDNIFIDVEQIIPIKEAEEYQIGIADKEYQEKIEAENLPNWHKTRVRFWETLLPKMNAKSEMFKNISPSKESWINCGSGVSGIEYFFGATKSQACVELLIQKSSRDENKRIFDNLFKKKDIIEKKFNLNDTNVLVWERNDNYKRSKITCHLRDVSLYKDEDWNKMIEFLIENMIKLEAVFRDEIRKAVSVNNAE